MSKQASIIGALISVIVLTLSFLVSFYVSSFASKSSMDLMASELKAVDAKTISELEKSNLEVNAKFDKILTALCLINSRTCKLR